jgi:hypothetical protein
VAELLACSFFDDSFVECVRKNGRADDCLFGKRLKEMALQEFIPIRD